MVLSDSPSHFFTNELLRSLNEQVFGIKGFSITDSSPLHATASVTLLEGQEITVKLDVRGYSTSPNSVPMEINSESEDTGTIFESVEDLFQSVSAGYGKKRHEILVQKLERLS